MSIEEIDKYLVATFGESVLEEPEHERQQLYSFCQAVKILSDNKLNLEFNQK